MGATMGKTTEPATEPGAAPATGPAAAPAPTFSVVTPTYNRAAELERTLAGLEAQTDRDFEVVVAVDGSTDGTLALLAAFSRRAGLALRVLSLTNGGQARARNEAIRAARGEYVLFCDDDLVLEPDVIAWHRAFHAQFERSVAVGSVTTEDGGAVYAPRLPSWQNLTGMNVSVARAALLEVGLFDEGFRGYGGEDLDLGLRLQAAGYRFRPLAKAGSLHLAPRSRGADKGRASGYQAERLARKYGPGVAWWLGVHPAVLAVKRAYLNPVMDRLASRVPGYAFERAYLEGALEARREEEADP
jgi:glycosyltransferase involved in cell wall biosynthesis